MEVVKLKNGSEEAKPLVITTMLVLESVMEDRPLALYDLVMKCRDAGYDFFADNGDYLIKRKLVELDGSIHSSIKNIILSAVKGDGIDMVVGSPLA